MCPITGEIPDDPVMLQVDGRVYSERALRRWLSSNHTSPHTRQRCSPRDIISSTALTNMCELARSCVEATGPVRDIEATQREIPASDRGAVTLKAVEQRGGQLLLRIECVRDMASDSMASDSMAAALGWSDIVLCIDNSSSTGCRVDERDEQSGAAVESGSGRGDSGTVIGPER